MAPLSLPALLITTLKTLHNPPPDDPIHACPKSTITLLPTRPAALIQLAHTKIHSYQFSNVPTCWRRLFTDASIAEAIRVIRLGTAVWVRNEDERNEDAGIEYGNDKGDGDWVQDAVRLLDMAVIMAGAPGRGEMVEDLLAALEFYIEERKKEPLKKRRKKCNLAFVTETVNAPEIRKQIPKHRALSLEAFEKHLPTAQPLVIQEVLTHWPALHERSWRSPDYLLERTFGGRRLVPVELGRSYTDQGWGQSIVTFKDFMDGYLLRQDMDDSGERTGYLAQYDLFMQVPSLRNDISIPDYCYTNPPPPAPGTPLSKKPVQEKLDEPLLNAWFGPAETVSPLHTDPYHNILCQVVGKKFVRLYDPRESGKLYAKGVEAGGIDLSNTSEVEVEGDEEPRNEMFPLFSEAEYVETILGEGDCLYIPVGWWHYVRSLSVSFSVSFWWN